MPLSQEKKEAYFQKIGQYFDEYQKFFIVGCDNVGSNQMQQVRKGLRGKAVVLMGKNTLIRKALRAKLEDHPNIEKILPFIKENIGFVFTNEDLSDVRATIAQYKVGAPARVGSVAPLDVTVPAGPTGMEPTQTSFFQALNISTKINKGQIEIVSDVKLITTGNKVTASQAALLQKLNIKPFQYGLIIQNVYDNGSLYDPKVLDLTDDDLAGFFSSGLRNIAAISMQLNYPTQASVPHSLVNGLKNVLSIALATEEYSFPLADKIKEAIKNPGVAAAPAAAAAAPAAGKKEEKKPEPESESDADMGLDLFG
eukprot:TRINITY_DN1706_c0_g1::TRINITY_DN1706_c0_g1_i1::g.25255::m.25255 TRINITY_DN1706_c0_g1::TRINITY_DN1706_c0_g1_i1::g.25255  ORF type:complete len:311 (+),score=142.07,sp/Q9DG68/RLA0_RANSY/61.74/1e-111,Ribosomal_L10/PF00466.15/2.6e-25,Ribosomal_L10/PF00466.15/5.4e+03,Ribosomal_60s/PF00428.14/6.8e+03,Ribosomal_60s/PF00428.14/6e-16,DUF2164/PF09932.4/17,DUF2164/PF09932.4/5.5 TRINITY_DN1706_c0_g1_i1:80-1012(+)